MKMKLSVTYDPARDAENHVRAIIDSAFMSHGRVRMSEALLDMVELDEVKNLLMRKVNRVEALDKITLLLSESKGRLRLNEKAHKLEDAWNLLGDQVIFQLEAFYNQEWPFEAVHVDLTTLPICPYDFKARNIFVHAKLDTRCQLRILSHELNHFMFYAAYSKNLFKTLGKEKFELLKESMTIFTNPEMSGKPNEEGLRKLYIEKAVKTIDEAVDLGAKFLEKG